MEHFRKIFILLYMKIVIKYFKDYYDEFEIDLMNEKELIND